MNTRPMVAAGVITDLHVAICAVGVGIQAFRGVRRYYHRLGLVAPGGARR